MGAAGTWYTSPRALLIEEVRFEGNQRAAVSELRHLIDVPNGRTHLGVSGEQIARNAEAHPWVREAWVRRTWHGLVVVVEEHRPVALAQLDQRLFYVDERGEAFLPARSTDLDFPIIAGLDPSVRALHPELSQVVLRDAISLLDTADERGIIDINAVSQVVFSQTRGFTIHLRNGSEVLFGLSGHSGELDRLSSLLASGVQLSSPTYVDLAPERVAIVRPIPSQGEG